MWQEQDGATGREPSVEQLASLPVQSTRVQMATETPNSWRQSPHQGTKTPRRHELQTDERQGLTIPRLRRGQGGVPLISEMAAHLPVSAQKNAAKLEAAERTQMRSRFSARPMHKLARTTNQSSCAAEEQERTKVVRPQIVQKRVLR
jgi:hypothetical protein